MLENCDNLMHFRFFLCLFDAITLRVCALKRVHYFILIHKSKYAVINLLTRVPELEQQNNNCYWHNLLANYILLCHFSCLEWMEFLDLMQSNMWWWWV